jgi:hypothetical protein
MRIMRRPGLAVTTVGTGRVELRPMEPPHRRTTVENTMDIGPNTPLRLAETPVATSIPGETVILDASAGCYYGLEGVGTRVWELLSQMTTLDEIVRDLTAEYDVDAATAERDVRALLGDLDAAGLIVVGESPGA